MKKLLFTIGMLAAVTTPLQLVWLPLFVFFSVIVAPVLIVFNAPDSWNIDK